ncbi:hypothetical protein J3R82DRAFT_2144 [Butyriboletus roseoflavus]|nr:hypothetical protein J3R82DRAFT_2144 [Butyriboletus roseoflavus]
MVILFLTVYKHFRFYREVKTSIVYTIYRDGLMYLISLMRKRNPHSYRPISYIKVQSSHANTIVDGAFPFQFNDLLDLCATLHLYLLCRSSDNGCFTCRLQIRLHSVLASRIMFNLRKSCYCIQTGTTMDSIMFSDDAFDAPFKSQSNGSELSGRGLWV